MNKVLTTLFLIVCSTVFAVQKSDNINRTIELLRVELDALQRNSPVDLVVFYGDRKKYLSDLKTIGDKVDELSLVMYSQRNHSIFSMAYSCKQVHSLYQEYKSNQYPVEEWQLTIGGEVERYNKLKTALERIDQSMLDQKTQHSRQVALLTCDSIVGLFSQASTVLGKDKESFSTVSKKIEALGEYSQNQYDWLKERIFLVGSTPYVQVLQDLKVHYKLFMDNFDLMFSFYKENKEISYLYLFSQFFKTMLVVGVLAWLVSFVAMKFLSRRLFRKKDSKSKKPYCTAILTVVLTIVCLLLLNIGYFKQGYQSDTSVLFVEYGLTIAIILLSITIRLSSKKLRGALMLYLPLLTIAFFPIIYRALVVPNEIVHFTFAPLLAITGIIYLIILLSNAYKASRIDAFYGWFSFIIIVACTLLAWGGYRFMSLQLLILWLTLLSAIQVLICIRFFMSRTERKYKRRHRTSEPSWYLKMFNQLIMPLLTVTMILCGCFWAANVFDLSGFFKILMTSNFLELPKVITLSVSGLLWIICIGIVVNYAVNLIKEVLQSIFGERYSSGGMPVFVSIGTIVVWIVYVAMVMHMLKVDYAGAVALLGGLGMGIGFAMKETIDNFICGLSLMTGRLKQGDMIDCDGVRGTVKSIGYRSTLIETIDGSIIAFLNSQLFAKTYRNLTRNHGYELAKVIVGVAYGTDVQKARECILNATKGLSVLQKNKSVVVFLDQFASSSVDLTIILWVPVHGKGAALSAAKEAIYKSFAENGIEIPFPQQDIYIRQLSYDDAENADKPALGQK